MVTPALHSRRAPATFGRWGRGPDAAARTRRQSVVFDWHWHAESLAGAGYRAVDGLDFGRRAAEYILKHGRVIGGGAGGDGAGFGGGIGVGQGDPFWPLRLPRTRRRPVP